MDTEAESHGEQFELDKLFEPDESIKLFKLEEQFGPDELKEFFELREQFQQDEQFEQGEQFVEIELDKLVPFGNHPFKLFQGRRLDDMIDEIGEPKLVVDEAKDIIYPKHTGIRILSPVIVRPVNNGQYEILDGHYRVAAARKLKSELKLNSVKVPAVVKTGLTDEEALSYVSKSNPIGLLLKYKIDISCNDYRTTKEFKRLNNHYMIFSDRYSPMSLREYIEHILLDRYRVNVMYQNKYSMGNTYELTEEECTDEAVAREIIRRNDPESEKMMEEWLKSNDPNDKSAYRSEEKEIENEVKKLVHTFNREGGYIQQLKNHLGVDLNSDSFDYRNIQNHRERAKILFLISNLRQKKVSLQMYSKPSMENVDNSFLGWKTYNGFYARSLMRTVEREIAPGLKTIVNAINFCA